MSQNFRSEDALARAAAEAGLAWREAGIRQLTVGLEGVLGAGKTAFVRALLRGLGYEGRVPSPTYTLLEHYALGELAIVHLDLYRLAEPGELEFLGLRDWLALPAVWVLVEWPDRGGRFGETLDLGLTLAIGGDESRTLTAQARSATGERALAAWLGANFK